MARSATSPGSIAARRSGTLPLLIVQGVLMTELAEAADIVLPGAAYVEKDAIYTNDQGRPAGCVSRSGATRRSAGGLAAFSWTSAARWGWR